MNIAIILFALGVIMIVAGYTNQISPQCGSDIKIRVVPRTVYDDILYNQELTDAVYKDQIGVKPQKDINDDNVLVDIANR